MPELHLWLACMTCSSLQCPCAGSLQLFSPQHSAPSFALIEEAVGLIGWINWFLYI